MFSASRCYCLLLFVLKDSFAYPWRPWLRFEELRYPSYLRTLSCSIYKKDVNWVRSKSYYKTDLDPFGSLRFKGCINKIGRWLLSHYLHTIVNVLSILGKFGNDQIFYNTLRIDSSLLLKLIPNLFVTRFIYFYIHHYIRYYIHMTYACHFTISKITLLFQCRVEIHRTLAKLHIKNLKMTPLK